MLGKTKGHTPAESDDAESTGSRKGASASDRSRKRPTISVATIRTRVAQLLWLVCVVAALFLAVGALLVALDANESNRLVEFVVSGAQTADLGIFSRRQGEGIFDFSGANAGVKRALVNWGLGAVAWLVVGKIVERIVRP